MVAAVEVSDSVSPAHVQVSQAVLQQLGLQPHRRVALRPYSATAPPQPPAAVVLHPVSGAASEAAPSDSSTGRAAPPALQQLSPQQLHALFAAWLQAQSSRPKTSQGDINRAMASQFLNEGPSHAASNSGPLETGPSQNGARAAADTGCADGAVEQAVPLQDGAAMWLQLPSQQEPAALFMELRWPPGVPRRKGAIPVQLSQFVRSDIAVELGSPVDLPIVSTGHPANAEKGTEEESQQDGKLSVGFGEKWQAEFVRPAVERLLPLLHDTSRRLLFAAGAPPPGGLLVCGPAGSGADFRLSYQCHQRSPMPPDALDHQLIGFILGSSNTHANGCTCECHSKCSCEESATFSFYGCEHRVLGVQGRRRW